MTRGEESRGSKIIRWNSTEKEGESSGKGGGCGAGKNEH